MIGAWVVGAAWVLGFAAGAAIATMVSWVLWEGRR